MKSFDDLDPTKNVRVLIYAPPGNGKTAMAATFPNVVFVDTDGTGSGSPGSKVVRTPWFRNWFPDASLIGYEEFADPVDEYGLFTKATGFMDAMRFTNQIAKMPEVETIVYDSLSSLQALAMHLGLSLSGRENRSKSLAKAKMKGELPFALPTQADFGSEMSVFEQFMDQSTSIPKNMVYLAHERTESNDAGGIISREPYLIGSSIRALVGKWFDEVWYLDVNAKGDRFLRTVAKGPYKSLKSRALDVPDGLLDPTYPKIMAAIKEEG